MQVVVFSTKAYDRQFLDQANEAAGHRLTYVEARLSPETARLAAGADAVCLFVNDVLDSDTIAMLSHGGTRLAVLRCAGFNNVDLEVARKAAMTVGRVPAYSPNAVAEHTIALILSLNRKIHRAYNRVREGNFALDGLLGFDLSDKVAGVIGTGKIGEIVARILLGFGCRVIAYDLDRNPSCEAMGVHYTTCDELLSQADIITLHCPLTPATYHLINAEAVSRMKHGVMLINTSRGAVVDARAIIDGLKAGKIGHVGLDVYEEEADLFFEDLSDRVIGDDVFARLLTFPNVLITGHQAFFTWQALTRIAETTIGNISAYERNGEVLHPVSTTMVVRGGG